MVNKTVIAGLVGLALAWTARAQAPVYSINVMGFQKVSVPANGLNAAGAPYLKSSDGINTVIGEQLTPGSDVSDADSILFFDPQSQSYRIAYLYDNGSQLIWRDSQSNQTATNPVLPGVGFWVKSNHSTNQTMYVSGNVITSPTHATPVAPGLQLLSYPYSYPVSLNALTLAAGATKGSSLDTSDALYLWNPDAQQFQIFFYYEDGSLVDFATGDPATNVISPGSAFWFKHLGDAFTWVETNRYTSP